MTEGETLYKMPLYQRYVLNTLNFSPGVTMNGYAYGGSLSGFNVAGLAFNRHDGFRRRRVWE